MAWKTVGCWALRINVVLLFALALWFRITSLGSMPEIIGDELWMGTQLVHFLAGKSISVWYFSGSPMNPFFAGMDLLLHLIFKPSIWLVRIVPAFCGVLAVVLTYVLGARMLDRTTALIASVLLAVLPIAIIFSRIGYDAAQTPLFSLIALYFAFKRRRVATLLSFVACFVVQPTNVFLLPTLMAIYLVGEARASAGDPARLRRLLLGTLAVSAALITAAGLVTLRRTYVHSVYKNFHLGHYDVGHFLVLYGRLLLGEVLLGEPRRHVHLQDALFWTVFGSALLFGTWRLVCQRQWDRVALVAGLLLSALGIFIVAGSNSIRPEMPRYGMFLVMPTVLAIACLARSLLISGATTKLAPVFVAQRVALLALGWALLWGTKYNWFDFYTRSSGESLWTLRTDSIDPNERVLAIVRHDARRSALGLPATIQNKPEPASQDRAFKSLIIAENWWTYRPLQYLTLRRPDTKVVTFEKMGLGLDQNQRHLLEQLQRGAYVVCFSGGTIERLVNASFRPERLQRWDVPHNDGDYFHDRSRTLAVFRMRAEPRELRSGEAEITTARPPAADSTRR